MNHIRKNRIQTEWIDFDKIYTDILRATLKRNRILYCIYYAQAEIENDKKENQNHEKNFNAYNILLTNSFLSQLG